MSTLFDLPLHEDFVQRHSETVEYTRCHKCPCGSLPDGSRSNVNCKACKGKGIIEDPPRVFNAIVTGVRAQKLMLDAGIVSFGDLMLSAPPFLGFMIYEYDRFRIVGWGEGEPYEGEILRRGVTDVDRLRYEPRVMNKVFSVDPVVGTVTTYTGYTTAGRDLTWTGTRPAPGQSFTVDYAPLWEWVAFLPTVVRREQADNLGQLVILKKLHTTTPF
jgi:hypothetical protein